MDFSKLKEFVDLAKEMGACQLEMQEGDKKFSVSFPTAASSPMMMSYQPTPSTSSSAPQNTSSKNDGLVEITSPFVGTYYSSPSPDSPVYVKKTDKVTKGQTLCIVEAMKIMNEIESEVSGEVVEICVENESYVEFGQVLFRVKP
jgi:acetyl-CoA carboxylase biotin carboxyl carrier protein